MSNQHVWIKSTLKCLMLDFLLQLTLHFVNTISSTVGSSGYLGF